MSEVVSYTTKFIKNLRTEEPFVFKVPNELLEDLEKRKKLLKEGKLFNMMQSEKSITIDFEFCQFPVFHEVLKIWIENGYNKELMTQILQEFGVEENMIQRLLKDKGYLSRIIPWFSSITQDGERAIRVLKLIYCETLMLYKLEMTEEKIQEDFCIGDAFFINLLREKKGQ